MTTQTLISEIETLPEECLVEAQSANTKIVYADLEEGYRAMAADKEYEKEAQEWVNGYTDIVAEVRSNRELLLEQHGGIDGLHKYMAENKAKLEAEGWKFVPIPVRNLALAK